jgi:hypothetical protein
MLHRDAARIIIPVVLITFVLSCARFQPTLDQTTLILGGNRIPSVVKTQAPITVSIEEFASPNKSKQAFDSDVIASGVLPLLFRFDNKGESVFKVPASAVKAYLGGQVLEVMNGETAAKQAATRDYVGKALGWTLLAGPFAIIAWPGTIVGSAMHTRAVNSHIVAHFEKLEFQGAMLRANEPVAGFVYYRVPADKKILESIAETKTLQNLVIEITASPEAEGQDVTFSVPFPGIELSQPVKN